MENPNHIVNNRQPHNDEKESGRDMQKIEKKKQGRKHNQPDEIEMLREKYQRLRLKLES